MRKVVTLHTSIEQDWQEPDQLLVQIAEYIHEAKVDNSDLLSMAKRSLLDSLACAMLGLSCDQCTKFIGPYLGGTDSTGIIVPGTNFFSEPVKAAFDLAIMINWQNYNDSFLDRESAIVTKPSVTIGAILTIAKYADLATREDEAIEMNRVLSAIVKAYELAGRLSSKLGNNGAIKVAVAGVVSQLLGGGMDHTISAVSNALLDNSILKVDAEKLVHRNRIWEVGDAAARGVELAFRAVFCGELGEPHVLSKSNKQEAYKIDLSTVILENIVYKISTPVSFLNISAVELALNMHVSVKEKLDQIKEIKIETYQLSQPSSKADDLSYAVVLALLYGYVDQEQYLDSFAKEDHRIAQLMTKVIIEEKDDYRQHYLDVDMLAMPSSLQITFDDAEDNQSQEIIYPLGHSKRRQEAEMPLRSKYISAIKTVFSGEAKNALSELWNMPAMVFGHLPVRDFLGLWQKH